MDSALSQVRIVLVEPAGPLNLGSVARVMKNMGLSQLVVVNPHCDIWAEEARRMAVHGADVLIQAHIVSTLMEALKGCERAVATTGRDWSEPVPVELPEVALPWLVSPADMAPPSALIFGPEDRGLSNEELNYAQRVVRIPTSQVYPSLNLAQAVAVCCYLLRRSLTAPAAASPPSPAAGVEVPLAPALPPTDDRPIAALEQVDQFSQQLESLLLKIGYLYPHTAPSRMAKFRRLLHRAAPDSQELAMLRGILRQVEWALRSEPLD